MRKKGEEKKRRGKREMREKERRETSLQEFLKRSHEIMQVKGSHRL